ncbi:hypothetical protein ACRRTK_008214 [Alexandromys fortis]
MTLWNQGYSKWAGSPEYRKHSCNPSVLQLLSNFLFLAWLLLIILALVSKVPSSQSQDKIYQELMQLKTEVDDDLCQPYQRDCVFFRGNCYVFSKSQSNWYNSINACQEVGAQMVIIETEGEQGEADEAELQRLVAAEQQKAQFTAQVHHFMELCWDKYVEKPGNRLDSRIENCLSSCVDRFIDTTLAITGFLDRGHISLVLQLLSLVFFAGLLAAIVIQVSKIPSSEEIQWEQKKQEKMFQDLSQLKSEVDSLCRRCPWDWTFFKGNCYFFSKSQRDWHDSITACQELGAQLVIIKSHEEQV